MVKNTLKYISIALVIVTILSSIIPNIVYAEDLGLGDLNEYKNNVKVDGKAKEKAEIVIGMIRTIGIVTAVVSLMVIGIKYMLSSIEEKAHYKEVIKPYLIGIFLIATVSLLPQLIYDIVKEL